jgi:isoquinoline 1-oxidoreductase beta subunit
MTLPRRTFLKVAATSAGGLLIGAYGGRALLKGEDISFMPNSFLRIDPDGTITIWSKNPEMGQGVKTAMPMIIAEELGADWTRVRVEQAPLNNRRYGPQGSGGSYSIKYDWDIHRRLGATARELLIAAAAARWRVPSRECRTEDGAVIHDRSNRRIAFGDLTADAATLRPPSGDPPLRDASTFRLIGRRVPGVDTAAIVTGLPLYGIDVHRPGMLYAVVEKCPVFSGRVRSIDDSRALAVPGVRRVVRIDGHDNPTFLQPGVAVVADSTWAAMKGRDALSVVWDEGPFASESTESLREQFRSLARTAGKTLSDIGDVDRALDAAAIVVDARFDFPFLPHAPMEPVNCTAHVTADRCDVVGPVQMPGACRRVVSAVLGIKPEQVHVTPTRIGGGFGRRLLSDYAAEAAVISRAAGAPVQVVWSREDDLRHDYYRPAGYRHIRAGLDAAGDLVAWDCHLVNVSRNAYRKSTTGPEATETYGNYTGPVVDAQRDAYDLDLTPTAIPNCRLRYSEPKTGVATGAWRAPAHCANAFAIETTIDELATRGRQDPVAMRLRFLGSAVDIPYRGDDSTPYNPARLKAVLTLAAEKSGWGTPATDGRARGIAAHYTFGSYAATCVELAVDAHRRVRIHRVVIAVDCGQVVNLSGVEAQAEGGTIDGLGAAFFGEVTIAAGRAETGNFDRYRLIRNSEAPPIEVVIVPSRERPTGFGEIAIPVIAPAVANAIAAATGVRLRQLPFSREGFSL